MTAARAEVWILDGSVAVTGALVSAREMARAVRDVVDVVLVLPDSCRMDRSHLEDFTVVHHLPIRPLRRGVRDVALYLPMLMLATFRLHRLLARSRAEVLLVNDFYLMQGPLLRLLGYRGRIITWVRIDPAVFGRAGGIWLSLAAHFSDRIVAVSRHVQKLLPATIRSSLLYGPVSAEFVDGPAARKAEGRDFVFLGNYIDGKGQDIAISALAHLLPAVPEARLRFHGGDMGLRKNREYLAALKRQAEELGVSEAVSFGDFAPSPRSTLEGAFAALNLSRSESFSRTVLEASACGVPVIATRCGGPEEIVEDGRTGVMIPVGDAGACAAAMHRLCQDPALAAAMGDAGRERVMQLFAPDTFATRLRALIFGPA